MSAIEGLSQVSFLQFSLYLRVKLKPIEAEHPEMPQSLSGDQIGRFFANLATLDAHNDFFSMMK
jgi:hypothetical protein